MFCLAGNDKADFRKLFILTDLFDQFVFWLFFDIEDDGNEPPRINEPDLVKETWTALPMILS